MSQKSKRSKAKDLELNLQIDSSDEQSELAQQRSIISATSHSGPLPSASHLAEYEKHIPGSAKRIISMAESNMQHQKDMEIKALGLDAKKDKLGQIFAFIIALFGLSMSAVIAYFNYPWVSGLMGSGILVSLVTVFLKSNGRPPTQDK